MVGDNSANKNNPNGILRESVYLYGKELWNHAELLKANVENALSGITFVSLQFPGSAEIFKRSVSDNIKHKEDNISISCTERKFQSSPRALSLEIRSKIQYIEFKFGSEMFHLNVEYNDLDTEDIEEKDAKERERRVMRYRNEYVNDVVKEGHNLYVYESGQVKGQIQYIPCYKDSEKNYQLKYLPIEPVKKGQEMDSKNILQLEDLQRIQQCIDIGMNVFYEIEERKEAEKKENEI